MAKTITLEIWDAGGVEMTTAALPTDVPAGRLTAALVQRLGLARRGADGQAISYRLNHQTSGRQLLADQTLAEAAVREGDVLRILREILAG